jgi:HTH-type transcriptional repressor of NAD biosynthesis genes
VAQGQSRIGPARDERESALLADPQLDVLAGPAYDTILLCAPDFPFVQDGTRRDTEFRTMQHNWYRNVLDQKQIA